MYKKSRKSKLRKLRKTKKGGSPANYPNMAPLFINGLTKENIIKIGMNAPRGFMYKATNNPAVFNLQKI